MKLPNFFIGLFTLLLCISVNDINAQNCRKSKSNCNKEKTTKNVDSKKQSNTSYHHFTNQSKTSTSNNCNYKRNYNSHCTKSKSTQQARTVFNKKNYMGLLVGAATLLDTDETAFTTGIEYERFLNSKIGLGISSEFTFGKDLNVMLGLPISFHPTKRVKLFASPLASFQQSTIVDRTVPIASDEVVTIKDWNNYFGGRLGVAYFLTTKGLKIAPTVKADFINSQVRMNYGITAGIGF